MKFIKKNADILMENSIFMPEISVKPAKPWHLRAREWLRRNVSERLKKARSFRARPLLLPPAVSNITPNPVELDRTKAALWPGFEHRYGRLIKEAQALTGAPHEIFRWRFLEGLLRLSADPYKTLNKGLDINSALLFYQYGKLIGTAPDFHPSAHQAAEFIVRENLGDQRSVEFLLQEKNLRSFMHTLDHLLSEARQKHETDIRQLKDEEKFTASINFLNLQMRVVFEKQRIAAVEIEALKTRQEERAAAREKALKLAAEYGAAIASARKAVNTRSEKAITLLMENGKGLDIAVELFKASPDESLPGLIETAVDLSIRKEKSNVVTNAIFLAAKVLRANPEKIAALVSDLVKVYANKDRYTVPEEPLARIAVLKDIFSSVPEAVPHLIKEHDRNYSWIRAALAALLNIFRIKIKDISSRLLAPLISKIAASREGEDALLLHAYSLVKENDISQSVSEQARTFRLARGRLGKKLALLAARNALKHPVYDIPIFAKKSVPEEIRESIVSLSNTDNFHRTPRTLARREAVSLIFVAAKIQMFMDIMRNKPEENEVVSMLALNDLDKIDGSYEFSGIRIPHFDLFARYRDGTHSGQEVLKTADLRTEYLAVKSSNGNPISAMRAIEMLKSGEQVIWKMIPSPINEAERGDLPGYSLPLIAHYVRYAYCMLAAKDPMLNESRVMDLKAALQADGSQKQLFLTLQSLPQVIKKEFLKDFKRLIEEAGHPELVEIINGEGPRPVSR